jgi:hypothetical protein
MKKPLAYLMIVAVLFTATAEAKKKRKGKGGKPRVDKEQVERERKRDAEKKAVDGMLDERDLDKNGLLKLDEWLVPEDNEEAGTRKFQSADKNRDRHLSRSEIGTMLGF